MVRPIDVDKHSCLNLYLDGCTRAKSEQLVDYKKCDLVVIMQEISLIFF
jgi:hypothetical protein